jgi:hypothetical protein
LLDKTTPTFDMQSDEVTRIYGLFGMIKLWKQNEEQGTETE